APSRRQPLRVAAFTDIACAPDLPAHQPHLIVKATGIYKTTRPLQAHLPLPSLSTAYLNRIAGVPADLNLCWEIIERARRFVLSHVCAVNLQDHPLTPLITHRPIYYPPRHHNVFTDQLFRQQVVQNAMAIEHTPDHAKACSHQNFKRRETQRE